MKLLSALFALATLFTLPAHAQGVGTGVLSAPDTSAARQVRSTAKAMLLPHLTSGQRAAITSPASLGQFIFQTDNTPGVYFYNGTNWLHVASKAGAAHHPTQGVATILAGSGTKGTADGPGPAAQFSYPTGIACDGSGNVYVVDQGSNRIRRIVVATGVVTTLAGSRRGYADGTGPAAQFDGPYGVACDGSGHVYVTDQYNNCIRRIEATTGVVTTLAGSRLGFADGAGPAANFYHPASVAYDGQGNLYVGDYFDQRSRRIAAATGVVTTLAGTPGNIDSTGTATQPEYPAGIACDASGNVYVASYKNHCIYVIR